MSRTEDIYKPALEGKKIPVLTLDNKWHQLFTQARADKRIKRLEDELNELLKRQGKAVTETKEIKKLKKRLMSEIMDNAVEASVENNHKAQKKNDENKRLINDCNEMLDKYKDEEDARFGDELLELPREIEKVNHKLMLLTMEACYDRLKKNEKEIDEISRWVTEIRTELKERLVHKQEMEMASQELYSYMHDIFGADVINIFDMKYQVKEIKDDGNKNDV